MPITISGSRGRLRSGARTLATLGAWTVEPVGDTSFRVRCAGSTPDAFWWAQRARLPLVVELPYGRAGLRGSATIESDEPLVVLVEYHEEAHSA